MKTKQRADRCDVTFLKPEVGLGSLMDRRCRFSILHRHLGFGGSGKMMSGATENRVVVDMF